jgi:hypothetical protein
MIGLQAMTRNRRFQARNGDEARESQGWGAGERRWHTGRFTESDELRRDTVRRGLNPPSTGYEPR